MKNRTAAKLLVLVLTGSAIAMIVGAWDRDNPALYRLALGLAIFAGTGLMVLRTAVTEHSLKRAWQDGWDEGFATGARAAETVAAESASGGSVPLSLVRPTQQLVQEDAIGRGTDRVV